MIESVAADFPVADEHIVAPRSLGVEPQFLEHHHHHVYIFVESEVHVFVFRDIREHDIAHIRIHASSTAFSSVGLYRMFPAVVEIYLGFHQLVPTEYHAGLHLPHEEAVFLINGFRHIFFHGEIERQAMLRIVGQCYIQHFFC